MPATQPRNRSADLSSALFDRPTPDRPTPPPDAHGVNAASQVGGGRMDWTHDRADVLLKVYPEHAQPSRSSAENWHAHQLELASFGVLDGSQPATVAAALARAGPPAKLHTAVSVTDVPPERRKLLLLETSGVMRDSIAPGGGEDEERARSALRAQPLEEAHAAELTWIRVDGVARDHIDRTVAALATQAAALASAPLEAYRAATDPLTGAGKGVAFLAFAAPGYADVTDVAHELRLRGYTVAPISYRQMCALLA